MTKGELEKEAEKFVCNKSSFWKQGKTCVESVRQAYVMGAEPREKRIAELEKENKKLRETVEYYRKEREFFIGEVEND